MPLISHFRTLVLVVTVVARAEASTNVARIWDEQILAAIRIDLPNPPVHARNLFHFSVAMYDAWAAFDPTAVGYLYHGKPAASDVSAARSEAISYAAYRLLKERYALSRNAAATTIALDGQMAALGYGKDNVTLDTSTPAGVGNSVAAAVSAYFLEDGALQDRFYTDFPAAQGGYAPVNPPLDVAAGGTAATNVNQWQPLFITNAAAQNGISLSTTQRFLGSQWLGVRPFALARSDSTQPWFDPGPPPHLDGAGDAQYRSEVADLIRRSSQLTPDDGVVIDISPGVFGNNSLGANDGTGHPLNPSTGLPYAPNPVKRGDFGRVLAEFWADGPNSETPPGHWNVIANQVSDNPLFTKQLGGTGPVLDDLQWDVKVYFALNAAVHDAACAAWSLKRGYDGWRPIEAIRYMGERGQSSDPTGASYDPDGLPLIPGLIEVVTTETSQPGARHAGLPVGAIALFAWPGQPVDPTNEVSGVQWILASKWLPYQKSTFVTPAFPGYPSGHSTFSRAAAEVLAAMTGSPFFPGGLGSYGAWSLTFEKGPSQPVVLQWATYFDASDQAGISRLWGGIHVSVDDLTGRRLGAQCGQRAWNLARQYFDGSILQTPVWLSMAPLDPAGCQVRFNTLRGFFYKLQSTMSLDTPFVDDPGGYFQATDASITLTNGLVGACGFYRVVCSMTP
jgi:hypothetical protein